MYIDGYRARAAFEKLSCAECKEYLTVCSLDLVVEDMNVIRDMSRGLQFPRPFVVNAVLRTSVILEEQDGGNTCPNGHIRGLVLKHVSHAAVNTLLNNYTNLQNDHSQKERQQATSRKRKLGTLREK